MACVVYNVLTFLCWHPRWNFLELLAFDISMTTSSAITNPAADQNVALLLGTFIRSQTLGSSHSTRRLDVVSLIALRKGNSQSACGGGTTQSLAAYKYAEPERNVLVSYWICDATQQKSNICKICLIQNKNFFHWKFRVTKVWSIFFSYIYFLICSHLFYYLL